MSLIGYGTSLLCNQGTSGSCWSRRGISTRPPQRIWKVS